MDPSVMDPATCVPAKLVPESEIAAAACAAVEQPTRPSEQEQLWMQLKGAQSQAASRRGFVASEEETTWTGPSSNEQLWLQLKSAQCKAATRRRFVSPEEMIELVRSAQKKNIPAAQSGAMAAPKWADQRPRRVPGEPLRAEDFLGNWIDMQGNSVHVYSTDAWQMRLVAAMSRPPRPDVLLSIRPGPNGWCCGSCILDIATSSPDQINWLAPDGWPLVWLRGRQ